MYLALLNTLFFLRMWTGRRQDIQRLVYWAVLTGLFLFSAFRFRVGCDWSGYYYNFIAGSDLTQAEALAYREPGWWLIQIAFNHLNLPYPSVNILTSAIFFTGVHALAKRQPDRLGFLVLLFPILIVNMPMSGIRQAAAIGFFCLAITAFIDQRPIRFVIWLLIGSTIHSSVAAFLLLTPLATGQYSKKRVLLAIALAIPGLLILLQSDNAQLAIDRYVDSGVDAFGAVFRAGLLTLSGIFFFLILRKRWEKHFSHDYGIVNTGAWMMISLVALLPLSTVISDRLGYYLIPIQSMIFARIAYFPAIPNRTIYTALPYLGLLVVFTVWSLNSSHFKQCYEPYQNWMLGHPDFGTIGF